MIYKFYYGFFYVHYHKRKSNLTRRTIILVMRLNSITKLYAYYSEQVALGLRGGETISPPPPPSPVNMV